MHISWIDMQVCKTVTPGLSSALYTLGLVGFMWKNSPVTHEHHLQTSLPLHRHGRTQLERKGYNGNCSLR